MVTEYSPKPTVPDVHPDHSALTGEQQQKLAALLLIQLLPLKPPEKKWSTIDCKLWAIVWSVKHFIHFLSGSYFTVVTDHKSLLGLRKAPVDNNLTGRRS